MGGSEAVGGGGGGREAMVERRAQWLGRARPVGCFSLEGRQRGVRGGFTKGGIMMSAPLMKETRVRDADGGCWWLLIEWQDSLLRCCLPTAHKSSRTFLHISSLSISSCRLFLFAAKRKKFVVILLGGIGATSLLSVAGLVDINGQHHHRGCC